MSVIFETERLRVRLYSQLDEENFFALNGNEEVMRYIRPAKNRGECNDFFKTVIAESNLIKGRWAVEEKSSGTFIGSFALIPIDFENTHHLQLGYSLLKPFWGKGYASELTKQGIDYYFANYKEEVLFAYTDVRNVASQKVLLKSGFKQAGNAKDGDKALTKFIYHRP